MPSSTPRRARRPLETLALTLGLAATIGLGLSSAGCINSEEVFTEGRLEDLCNGSVPVCNLQARCVLTPKRFLRSSFPGGQRIIVRSDFDNAYVRIRMHFTELIYPGTELVIQVHDPQCTAFDEEQLVDIDIFDFMGDDRILEFEMDLPEEGDHLVELFSDMSAEYLLTVDIEELRAPVEE